MSQQTITISDHSQGILDELTVRTGQTAEVVIDRALDALQRNLFFETLDAGYANLQQDTAAWAELQEERQLWDSTLMDGLDPQEHWDETTRMPGLVSSRKDILPWS